MIVNYFQIKSPLFSINMLFEVIKTNLQNKIICKSNYLIFDGRSVAGRFRAIFLSAKKSGEDINHVVGDFNYSTYFMKKNKTILTIHDLYRINAKGTGWIRRNLFRVFWLQIPIWRSQFITTGSHWVKYDILKNSFCNENKIRVIYDCVSDKFYQNNKVFNKKKPILLQVGTRKNKNIIRLAEAIHGIHCRLEIIGQPDDETIKYLEFYGIDYGYKSGLTLSEVINKYNECDVVVFISTHEGFGLPIVEANMVGRVVVTSNVTSMPEVAGNSACLIDPFDIKSIRNGIIRVIEDDLYRENLIHLGKINSKRFHAKKIAYDYIDLYNEVLELNS